MALAELRCSTCRVGVDRCDRCARPFAAREVIMCTHSRDDAPRHYHPPCLRALDDAEPRPVA